MFFDGEHVLQSDLFSNLIKLIATMRNAVLQRFNITLQVLCSKPYDSQCIGAGQRRAEKSPFQTSIRLGNLLYLSSINCSHPAIKRVLAASKDF